MNLNELRAKKIEVDKEIKQINADGLGHEGWEYKSNPYLRELEGESKALSLGIEVCENIVKQNERLEKCSICKRVFWDKRCPDCIREILDKQMKEILEIIDKYDKYPSDVFPFMKKLELRKIDVFMKETFGFPLDRLSSHLMRLAQENIKEELKAQLKGDKK